MMSGRNRLALALCAFMLATPFLAVAEETFSKGILWPDDAVGQVVVLQNGTNLRQGGSTNYNVAGQASRGDIFFVVDQADTGWYALRMKDGDIAFISPKMVEFTARAEGIDTNIPTPSSGAVVFADPVVEALIRTSLGKPSGAISIADMESIIEIRYDAVNDQTATDWIYDLSDLELCKNLRVLQVSNQPITSIEPLRNLNKLQEVSLHGCSRITDISALGGKTQLTRVWLNGVPVSDASMVLSLPNLTFFNASWGTYIHDISALRHTSSLEAFFLEQQIGDLSPLLNHPRMRELSVAGISREQFAEMATAWPNLARLDLMDSEITGEDLHLLDAHRMEAIRLIRCPIGSDLSALAGQPLLSDLRLVNCLVTDIAPLASLTKLSDCLDLRDNAIVDISPVTSLKYLQRLDVSTTAPYTLDELRALMPATQIFISTY